MPYSLRHDRRGWCDGYGMRQHQSQSCRTDDNECGRTVNECVVTAVVVTKTSASGASMQLSATARMSDGSSRDATSGSTWESSNPVLASVSSAGTVTVIGSGELDVRATYQGVVGSFHVSASAPRTFTLSGMVAEVGPNARPIVGARVQIVVGSHTFSDDRGAFAISGLPAGRTIYEVTKDGYEIFETDVVIKGDTQLNIKLYPAPPQE